MGHCPFSGGHNNYLCLVNKSSNACMLCSDPLHLTTATSGYLDSSSITTSRYMPSAVGPQRSADSFCQDSSGDVEGVLGS